MGLYLLVGGLILLCLPGMTRRLGSRLAPAEWARMCGLALLVGAVTLEVAALVYAAPIVLHTVGPPGLTEVCEQLLSPLAPGGPVVGWLALIVGIAMPTRVVVAAVRSRRGARQVWIEPCVGRHATHGRLELVELPTDRLVALSVPTPTPQIIVSRGLSETLGADELDAVYEHERAHIELHHHRFLLLAASLEAGLRFLPLRASARAMRAAVERWADEAATGDCPQARAALRSALFRVTTAALGPSVAAFSSADSVIERLDALDRPPRRLSSMAHAILYTPGVLLAVSVVVVLVATASLTSCSLPGV